MSTVSRRELADFIAKVGRADVDESLWARMMVNHYPDDTMEHARRECVRIALKANGDLTLLSDQDAEHLQLLAAALVAAD